MNSEMNDQEKKDKEAEVTAGDKVIGGLMLAVIASLIGAFTGNWGLLMVILVLLVGYLVGMIFLRAIVGALAIIGAILRGEFDDYDK